MCLDFLTLVLQLLLCIVYAGLDAPLILLTEPQCTRVSMGERMVLECGVMNDGLDVRFQWFFSTLMPSTVITTEQTFLNAQTFSKVNSSTLVFEEIEPHNTGYYQCVVTSEDSKIYSRMARVEVHYLVNRKAVVKKTKEVKDVYSAFLVELNGCNTDNIDSFPPANIVWESVSIDVLYKTKALDDNMLISPVEDSFKDITNGGVFMRRSVSKDSLLIYNIRSDQGSRVYTCYAEVSSDLLKKKVAVVSWAVSGAESHNFDKTDSRYNYMTNAITTSNPSVDEGGELVLRCAGAGHSLDADIKYSWINPGGKVISNTNEMVVQNITSADEGKYVCQVELGGKFEHGITWVSVNGLQIDEKVHYTVVPQELWYVVVYSPADIPNYSKETAEKVLKNKKVKTKKTQLDEARKEREGGETGDVDSDVSKNVTKRSVQDLWKENVLYVSEEEHGLEKRDLFDFDYETINPICLSNNSRVSWLYNGQVVRVPIQLPALPRTFLTFQCTASNTLYWEQKSIAVYIDSAQTVTVPDMMILEDRGSTFVVSCNSSGFPPPDLELRIDVYPPVKNEQIVRTKLTRTQYDSVLWSEVEKHEVMEVTCVSSNPYYKESVTVSYEFERKEDVVVKTEAPSVPKEEEQGDNNIEAEEVNEFEYIEEVKEGYIQTPIGEFPLKIALSAIIGGSVILILVIIFTSCFIVYKKRERRSKRMMIADFKRSIHLQLPVISQVATENIERTYDVPRGSEVPLMKPPRIGLRPTQRNTNSLRSINSLKSCKSVHPADELEAYEHRRHNGVHPDDDFMREQYDINKKVTYTEVEVNRPLSFNFKLFGGVPVLPSLPPIPRPEYTTIQPDDNEGDDPIYENALEGVDSYNDLDESPYERMRLFSNEDNSSTQSPYDVFGANTKAPSPRTESRTYSPHVRGDEYTNTAFRPPLSDI